MGDIFSNILKILEKYGYMFVDGTLGTLRMSAIAVGVGTILGVLVAIMKMSRALPLSILATAYIEVIRGTPLLVQMYMFFFVVPLIFPALNTSADTAIILALVLNSAGYMAEIIRSGIQAVDRGQTEAARSLGLTSRQTMVQIILPQAVKNILPALCNEFITIIKETAIVAVFFGTDIMTAVNLIRGFTYLNLEPLFIAAGIYFILTFTLSKLVAVVERRLKASD
jgi:His/Glu/Gln/Arg/opine family amino acid ABC transporter permease subunit